MVYRLICRLTEEVWSRWSISPDMKDILRLSEKLWKWQKEWLSTAHQHRNWNQNPEEGPHPRCQACAHLNDAQKCIQHHHIYEGMSQALNNKDILSEEQDMTSPLV